MKRRVILATALILTAALILPSLVLGVVMPPCNFYGTVKLDGANVPEGTTVSAWVGEVMVAETVTLMYEGGSVYSFYVEGNYWGKTVSFEVAGLPAIEFATWEAGANKNVDLNISIEPDEVVTFPDPNLEAAIREALGIGPDVDIYRSDLETLTELNAPSRAISDLTGLEYAVNLTQLSLGGNQIIDLSPLANLTNLTRLLLWDNQISDIFALSSLTNLTKLWLWDNQIIDLSPLANLTNLTSLLLVDNQIIDLSPLANLTNLTELWLSDNQIADISPLASLTNLTSLGLMGNQITDLTPLANLTNLTSLLLVDNQITDLTPLANLTNLTSLALGGNQITDLSPLANLTGLTLLWLWDNQIIDFSPLANLTNLTSLELGGNQISDLSPLSNLTSLTWLWLEGNQISDINALSELSELRVLYLDSNQITDITPLSGLTKLGEAEQWWFLEREGKRICLGLRNNQISDISPLVQNPGLSEGDGIDLRGNPLSADSLNSYIPQLEGRGVLLLYTPPIEGDVNRDGKVDFSDLAAVASAFNTKEGMPNWNPAADLNDDGIVDIFDLVSVGRNFGTEGPEEMAAIRVGVGAPFTGVNAMYGELIWRGVELMAEEVNAAGGIGGRMIELVKFDSVGDPKEAVTAAHLAADDPTIPVLVGFVFSGCTFSAQPVLKDAGLVNISPTNTHKDIGITSEYTFRVVYTDAFQAEFLAQYVDEVLGLKKVAVMYEQADYHIGLLEAFVPAAEARGIEVVTAEAYPTGAVDFLPSLTNIKGLAPKAIFLASYFSEAGLIVKQAREILGMDVLFFGADGVMMPDFVEVAGVENAEGVIGSMPFIADKELAGPITLEFLLAFEERFGLEANWFAAKTYDALGVVIRALRAVGPDVDFDAMAMRPLIREYFVGITSPEVGYEGVTGLIYFDEHGDSVGPAFMGIFEDGIIKFHPRQLL